MGVNRIHHVLRSVIRRKTNYCIIFRTTMGLTWEHPNGEKVVAFIVFHKSLRATLFHLVVGESE